MPSPTLPDRTPDRTPGGVTGGRRPALLTVVAVLVGAEALLLVVGAGYVLAGLLTEDATDPLAAVFLAVLALAFAGGLAVCGRGVLRRAAWSRSPLLVWQVLQIAAGVPAFRGGSPWFGVLLVVPAVLVLVGLFSRPVARATAR